MRPHRQEEALEKSEQPLNHIIAIAWWSSARCTSTCSVALQPTQGAPSRARLACICDDAAYFVWVDWWRPALKHGVIAPMR